MGKWFAGGTCEIFDSFVGLTSNYVLVVAIGFSVCFFKEDDPKLLITLPTPAENQILAIGFGGDEPVKFYKFPDAVKAQPN